MNLSSQLVKTAQCALNYFGRIASFFFKRQHQKYKIKGTKTKFLLHNNNRKVQSYLPPGPPLLCSNFRDYNWESRIALDFETKTISILFCNCSFQATANFAVINTKRLRLNPSKWTTREKNLKCCLYLRAFCFELKLFST